MQFIKNKISSYIRFLADNQQVFLSLLLILLVPGILVFNTVFVVKSMDDNMNYELRLKAEMAGSIVARYSSDLLGDPTQLQAKIKLTVDESLHSSTRKVTIMVPEGENFQVLASSDQSEISQIRPQLQYTVAWHQHATIAQLVQTVQNHQTERLWQVVTPIATPTGSKLGLVEILVSTADMDARTQTVLVNSVLVLVASIGLVLLLIANNARLFQYALLFHKLQEVDKMKDNFISIASHELKTPVTAAKGFLSLVEQEKQVLPAEIQSDINKANMSLERLSDLVNDLLNVSRIEQKRLAIDPVPTDIRTVVGEVFEDLSGSAQKKGLTIEYHPFTGELPPVLIDPAKFRQIMVNLLTNAIKYTISGKVEVNIIFEDLGKVAVSVKDTGIGMSAGDMEKLFTQFYRVRNRKARDIVGTGLGLWITKQLTEMMDGKILVESIEDVGSRFTVVFSVIPTKKK